MSSSTEVVPWGDQFISRAEIRRRQRRRESRRFWGRIAACATAVVVATLGATLWANRPPGTASAIEVQPPATTRPIAPEWTAVPPPTTAIIPESVPTSIAPNWTLVKLSIPSCLDCLGRLVTDGVRAPRVLPGELGRAVIAVDADPSTAATIVVEGREFRVLPGGRGTFKSNDLAGLVGARPTIPTVVLVSSLAGDDRPFVEAS